MRETTVMAKVSGRVQGVGFRHWTAATASGLGLRGWVRNEADGSVTALMSGPEEAVARMLGLLREGPAAARVDRVDSRAPEAGTEVPAGFRQLR